MKNINFIMIRNWEIEGGVMPEVHSSLVENEKLKYNKIQIGILVCSFTVSSLHQ